jgi:predicted RNA-binding protein with PIN domain
MSQQFLLIDGYNLLHCSPFGRRRYGPGQFQRCRQQMVDELNRRLDARTAARAVIVFDGQTSADSQPVEQASGPPGPQRMRVIYSGSGVEADAVIEELLRRHPAPQHVIVVSDDRRLQSAATRRGARYVKSSEFWSSIEADAGDRDEFCSPASANGSTSTKSEPGHAPDVDLTAAIEREFLAVDPDSLRTRSREPERQDRGHRRSSRP